MRAAILQEYGATPVLGEFPDPEPGQGQAVVEVLAAGLNPVDIRKASGTFYGGSPPLPSVAGSEGVGRLRDGGRHVYFETCGPPYGSLAERTLIDRAQAFAVPERLDPALAVCFGVAGLAGWLSVTWRSGLQEGETVLVLGSTGTVGQIAVQAARLAGAGRVVAVGRRPDGLERARELGADATVSLDEPDDLAEAFREACGGGVDVVIDPLWGEPARAALDALRPYGRHVQLGQSAAAELSLPSSTIRGRPLAILGYTNFAVPLDVRREAYERMAAHGAAGQLTADHETVPLDRAPEAWERQKAGPGTKLVVAP